MFRKGIITFLNFVFGVSKNFFEIFNLWMTAESSLCLKSIFYSVIERRRIGFVMFVEYENTLIEHLPHTAFYSDLHHEDTQTT